MLKSHKKILFILLVSLHLNAFNLEDVERKEIRLTPATFTYDIREEETAFEFVRDHSESLREREFEFKIRCKLFGLNYSFDGIVSRQDTEIFKNNKFMREIIITSYVQCIDRE